MLPGRGRSFDHWRRHRGWHVVATIGAAASIQGLETARHAASIDSCVEQSVVVTKLHPNVGSAHATGCALGAS